MAQAAQEKEVPLTITQKLSAGPRFGSESAPPLFVKYFTEVAPKIEVPPMSAKLLKLFTRKDVKANEVALVLKTNPYYEAQFIKYFFSIAKKDQEPSVEAMVVLLGMQKSRNLAIALQLHKTVTGEHPPWDQNGKLTINPDELLKCAAKAEEPLGKDEIGFSETAFGAGLIFDYLKKYAEVSNTETKVTEFIDTVFKYSLRAGRIAMELAKGVPDFTMKKYLYSAGLIHKIGQPILALTEPSYVRFWEEGVKKELPETLWHRCEKNDFGITYDHIGYLLCQQFDLFKPIAEAVLHQHQPLRVPATNKALHQFANALCLLSSLTRHFKKTTDAKDPAIPRWKGAELKHFKISLDLLFQVVNAVEI